MNDYQILLDIWEGNPDLDAPALKDAGVKGLIVRLNSMSGGLHMDDQFPKNWALAQEFDAQAIYFVYNPWKDGSANYEWLEAHIPADYGDRRIFADVEVRYAGYPPATYGHEVEKFKALARASHPLTVYSGGGYLDILTPWPKEDYWWAGYLFAFNDCKTWEEWRAVVEQFDASPLTTCPGTIRLWQTTGDNMAPLPGFGGHKVDTNVFYGTEVELMKWFGCEKEQSKMDWTKNSLGYVTEKAVWTPGLFQFITGYAGGNWTKRTDGSLVLEPNPDLKAIETKARSEGLPFFVVWDFDVAYYANSQYDANDATWPSEANDYPLQRMISALSARDFDGLIVRVMNRKGFNDHLEMMNYISFAARKFTERANKWLYTAKGMKKQTLVMTSDPFVRQDGAQEMFYSWIKPDWPPVVVEQATTALVGNAYPASFDAPGGIGSTTWRMWYYWWSVKTAPVVDRNAGLMIFNGDTAALRLWLGLDTAPGDPGDPDPEPEPTDLKEVKERLATVEADMAALRQWLKSAPFGE